VDYYYATTGRIRYYGQIPTDVRKSGDEVRAKGVSSHIFGPDALSLFWENSLENASDQPIDLSRKKEPAHEALANLSPDLDSLYAFTKRWGFLAGGIDIATGEAVIRLQQVVPRQTLLRQAWRGDKEAAKQVASAVKARLDVGAKGIDIAVVDLWNFVRLLFLRDYSAGKTKVCGNPDCVSRYFLEQRKGQQYCSHKCAVLMNVRRFRQRQTTRHQKTAQHPKRDHATRKKGEAQ
jgi:hypothetical protein